MLDYWISQDVPYRNTSVQRRVSSLLLSVLPARGPEHPEETSRTRRKVSCPPSITSCWLECICITVVQASVCLCLYFICSSWWSSFLYICIFYTEGGSRHNRGCFSTELLDCRPCGQRRLKGCRTLGEDEAQMTSCTELCRIRLVVKYIQLSENALWTTRILERL